MSEAQAISIIERHYGNAWRKRIVAQHMAGSGRKTKAKDRDRDIAEAIATELDAIVAELRDAGYTITN